MISKSDFLRYQRQMILPELGVVGQQKLKSAKVLVVGAGGLGSPVLLYLAAAGIGNIGIVDNDIVDVSNLHRQVLFGENNINQSKAQIAHDRVQSINSDCEVKSYKTCLNHDNVLELFEGYDLIIDATDNFIARYLINDACVIQKIPLVSAAIYRFEGQLAVFNYKKSACFRCLYPSAPPPELAPNCATGGVIGILPGIIGCLQANEAIKVLAELGTPLTNELLFIDALHNDYRHFKFKKNPNCQICSTHHAQLFQAEAYTSSFCSVASDVEEITPQALKELLKEHNNIQVIDVREESEYQISNINGTSIPLSTIKKDIDIALNKIDTAKTIVIHCFSGARSQEAIKLLKPHLKHPKIYNLKGGLLAWYKSE